MSKTIHAAGPEKPAADFSRSRIVLFSLIIWLLLFGVVELGLRLFWTRPPERMGVPLRRTGLFRTDNLVGWRPNPNFSYVQSLYRGHEARIQTNSVGFRDIEHSIERDPNRSRVAVLGDSFTFGFGVSNGDLFTDRLRDLLPNVEVMNFGVTAWNLEQQRKLLESEVVRYKPDLVVVSFVQNDVTSSLVSLEQPKQEKQRWKARVKDSSYLATLMSQAINQNRSLAVFLARIGIKAPLGGYENLDTNLRPSLVRYPESLVKDWNAAIGELLQIERICDSHSIRLLVAAIPPRQALEKEYLMATLAYLEYVPSDFDVDKPFRELELFCRQNGIQYLNGLVGLRPAGSGLYLTYDLHFSAKGHREFAGILAPKVKEMLDSARSPSGF